MANAKPTNLANQISRWGGQMDVVKHGLVSEKELDMRRNQASGSNGLRRFRMHLPWFSRRTDMMSMPLRSVAREIEELYRIFD